MYEFNCILKLRMRTFPRYSKCLLSSKWSSIFHYIWILYTARDVYMHVLYNHVAHFLWLILMYSPTHHLTHSHWSRSYRRHPSVSPQCWSPTGELALPVFETSAVSACSDFLVTCGTALWSSGPPLSPSPGDHSNVSKGFLPSWVPPSVWVCVWCVWCVCVRVCVCVCVRA